MFTHPVRRFGTVAVLGLFLALSANVALADPPHPATGADGTHNCEDFDSAAQAQDYFAQTNGNNGPEEDLDRDNDGRACEWDGKPWTPSSDGGGGGAVGGDTDTPTRIHTGAGGAESAAWTAIQSGVLALAGAVGFGALAFAGVRVARR